MSRDDEIRRLASELRELEHQAEKSERRAAAARRKVERRRAKVERLTGRLIVEAKTQGATDDEIAELLKQCIPQPWDAPDWRPF